MGVTGLWRLVEPTGKPVPVETLENKVLAVDISIWLHQMVKGYQDAKGAPLPNAHLMGLFQRLCKLLYFRIKPVFVFDGAFPELKRETIAKRQDSKSKYHSESERLKRELALLLSKKTAVSCLLGKQISPKKGPRPDLAQASEDDLFKLPALPIQQDESDSESEDQDTSSGSIIDIHSVDLDSDNFKQMPAKEKYDVLVELKETRKMNSWGKLHELPKESNNFSDFQMQRLLKRRKVQEVFEETEKEMGSTGMSLNDLESLLNEEGIDTKIESMPTRRIASNSSTRFLLIKNVKQALADARKQKLKAINENTVTEPGPSNVVEEKPSESTTHKTEELDDDLQKAIQMSLECADEPNTSVNSTKTDESWSTFMTDSDNSNQETDSEEHDGFEQTENLSTAKAYIMQYSDYTPRAIDQIVTSKNKRQKGKAKAPKVDKIIEELNKEKSIIVDEVSLSSDDETDTNKQSIEHFIKPESKSDSEMDIIELNTTQEDIRSSEDEVEIISTNTSIITVDDTQNNIRTSSVDINEDAKNEVLETSKVNVSRKLIPDTTSHSIESESSDDNFEEVPADAKHNLIETKLSLPNNATTETESHIIESESSDDDFEEVPVADAGPKPVVELTLNVGEAPEDDIFSDVFTKNCTEDVALDTNISLYPTTDTKLSSNKIEKGSSEKYENCLIDEECSKETITENCEEFKIKMNKTNQKRDLDFSVHNTNSNDIIAPVASKPRVKNIPKDKNEEPIHSTDIAREIASTSSEKQTNDTSSELLNKNQEIKTHTIAFPKEPISTEMLNTMAEDIQNEENDLIKEKGRLDRIGRNITEQMTKEAQELLQIFGIPYVVAPMEAEAQCAFLESVNLTDGTITDDSDIWLFGGRTVYKNFFNQKKHVLQFLSERIERSFNLTREQLILLALLVGSDYTTGVNGVGPVTALEILASFPYNKKQLSETNEQARHAKLVAGLQDFKKWVKAGKRTDNTTLKKKLKNVDVADDFPSVRVVQAYLEPNVEKSEAKFSWGELDITILRDYTKSKFGWSQNKFDEIIKPVIKRMQDRQTQRTLQDYFKRKVEFTSLDDQMSKRVKAAVHKMGPETEGSAQVENDAATFKVPQKRKLTKKSKPANDETNEVVSIKTAKPSKSTKKLKTNAEIDGAEISGIVKIKSVADEEKPAVEIKINKTKRFQEVIPQREKDKQGLLQNKMKAIEVFRKTKLDRKTQRKKRRPNLPKEKADLSESSDSD